MSIKDLFDNRKTNNETISADAFLTASQDVESIEHIKAKQQEFDRFIPHVDYSTASNFAKYGSAELYYQKIFLRSRDLASQELYARLYVDRCYQKYIYLKMMMKDQTQLFLF